MAHAVYEMTICKRYYIFRCKLKMCFILVINQSVYIFLQFWSEFTNKLVIICQCMNLGVLFSTEGSLLMTIIVDFYSILYYTIEIN